MNNEVINTLITAVSSLIAATLGLFFGRDRKSKTSPENISYRLLTEVLEPMDCLLQLSNNFSEDEKVNKLIEIAKSKYVLIPPSLLDKIEPLNLPNYNRKQELEELSIIVGTLFNWHRKKLGFPYDKKRIVKCYLPSHTKNELILTSFFFLILLMWGLCCMLSLASLLGNNQIPGIDFIFLIAIVGLFFIFANIKKLR